MRCAAAFLAGLFTGTFACAQVSVCDLFKDLKAADGCQLIVTGELVISKDIAVLGAADCDNRYATSENGGIRVNQLWPTGLRLRPAAGLPADQLRKFQAAASAADKLRQAGKVVNARGAFAGRLSVAPVGSLPAQLAFDSVDELKVEALPDAGDLPVIPICELFQNLAQWKGKRIAVRAESVSTMEGSWLTGRCKGGFVTNGYRWPVSLDRAVPAYYSTETARLVAPKEPAGPVKGEDQFRGRYNVVQTATYVGRLRMRDQYTAVCRAGGDYITNGFGHQNGAVGELIVDSIANEELTAAPPDADDDEQEGPCQPANLFALCAAVTSLREAAGVGCLDQARQILSKEGVDGKDGAESAALSAAIGTGHKDLVELLLQNGAAVNPKEFQLWPPLCDAAGSTSISIMKILLAAGAVVDGRDDDGSTCLAMTGFFFPEVARVLLEAGANPDATNRHAQTALMQASGYGYEESVKLLVDHGANVNLKDNRGRTALMHAAAGKYVDAIPILLEHGADPYARDVDGKTALDIARDSHNQIAIELLTTAMK